MGIYSYIFFSVLYSFGSTFNPFSVNSCLWYEEWVQLYLSACEYSVVPTLFVQNIIFASLKCFGTCVKINWPWMWRFTAGLLILFCWSILSILIPVPHCLDYHSFIVSFKIRKYEFSNVVFLFQDYLDYSESLTFLYEF